MHHYSSQIKHSDYRGSLARSTDDADISFWLKHVPDCAFAARPAAASLVDYTDVATHTCVEGSRWVSVHDPGAASVP